VMVQGDPGFYQYPVPAGRLGEGGISLLPIFRPLGTRLFRRFRFPAFRSSLRDARDDGCPDFYQYPIPSGSLGEVGIL